MIKFAIICLTIFLFSSCSPSIISICPNDQVMQYQFDGSRTNAVECYTPAKDYGKICYEQNDCESRKCIVDKKIAEKQCNSVSCYLTSNCTSISGTCGAGREEGAVFIKSKNVVYQFCPF